MKYLIYRILGNDLPYRHGLGQTLRNTQFILNREDHVGPANRRWVLNRIFDANIENKLVRTLEKRGETFVRIPFEQAVFREKLARDRQSAFAYLTNVNAARNLALSDGLKIAEWVFPFDGSCIVPRAGIVELELGLSNVQTPLIVVRMARIRSFAKVNRPPVFTEEGVPTEKSLGFSRKSQLRFDENRMYGKADKAALLNQIGLPGPWNTWAEAGEVPNSAEAYTEFGYIVRLPSGNRFADWGYSRRRYFREECFNATLRYASLTDRGTFKLKWRLRVFLRNILAWCEQLLQL
ncbi:MAG: hypothetical protein R3B54_02325 [Bdellovibrionota bacterium]